LAEPRRSGDSEGVRVWIDQDLCTGDGLCTDHAPEVFTLLEDGIAYVKQTGRVLNDPGGSGSLAVVPGRLMQAVVHAAEDCPGECIFIEMEPSTTFRP
jgi:ferredoxin